jgi:hypothetical protein
MNNQEFKMRLYQKLSQLDVFYPKGDQISIRCPFCGDSSNNEMNAHFYIKLNMSDNEPVLFHCFRSDCLVAGVLTPTVLRTLKINDLQLNSSLLSYNSKAMKSVNKQFGISDNKFELTVPEANEDSELNIKKRDYINYRMGLNLSFKELTGLKTIFNFPHFLKHNGIDTLSISQKKAKLIHENYVGFLTTRNEFISFRSIFNNSLKRYEKYSLYQNIDNTRKFYTIPNQIDLLTTRTIKINIAEGTFDIFGVYYHVFNQEKDNMIYVAVNGAAYTSVIKYFIQMGVIGNVVVNIFSDNNMNPKAYKKMIDELSPWIGEFNLYYNEIEKDGKADFGVKSSEIKIRRKKL